jgi:hypothetical protein
MSDGFLAPLVTAVGTILALGLATSTAVILEEEVNVSIVTEAVIDNSMACRKRQGQKKETAISTTSSIGIETVLKLAFRKITWGIFLDLV